MLPPPLQAFRGDRRVLGSSENGDRKGEGVGGSKLIGLVCREIAAKPRQKHFHGAGIGRDCRGYSTIAGVHGSDKFVVWKLVDGWARRGVLWRTCGSYIEMAWSRTPQPAKCSSQLERHDTAETVAIERKRLLRPTLDFG